MELYVSHTIAIMRENCRVLRDDGVLFWNVADTYRHKSLVAVPQRVAVAAIEDGWFLRDVPIWAKPNPKPESVKDRLTRSYEPILMLTKNPRYYWNSEACREAATSKDAGADGTRNGRNVLQIAIQPFRGAHFAKFPEDLARRLIIAASRPGDVVMDVFAGSGTTGKVAMELGRRCVLFDRNYSGKNGYETLARQRFQKLLD